MAGTTEPGTGSMQVEQVRWALGEMRLRRENIGPDKAVEPAPAVPGFSDYFTEWQAPDPL